MRIQPEQLGKAIREVRLLRGLTQKSVADHIGVTVNYMSLLENGRRGAKIETLNSLAEILDVPSAFLAFLGTQSSSLQNLGFRSLVESTNATIRSYISATR